MGNYFSVLRDQFTESYTKKDMVSLQRNGKAMLALLNDMDTLLATSQNFLLGQWIESAKKFGKNKNEKNYYEKDAREIITIWGEPGHHLTDYANRSLAGLTKTYYYGRWKMFIDDVEGSLKDNKSFDDTLFIKKVIGFEDRWSKGHELYSSKPKGSCIIISRMLLSKYAEQIENVELKSNQ